MKKKKIASFIKKIIGVIARIAGKLTDEYKKRSEYGFIYILVSILVKVLCVLNLVEWFKLVFYKICRLFQKGISCRAAKNWAIDIFIVLKFIFLFVAIKMHPNPIIVKVVVYLLLMNVFTYFY